MMDISTLNINNTNNISPTTTTATTANTSTSTTNTNTNNNDDIPLSMKFLHKPRRSEELYIKSNDQTRRNSQLNSKPIPISLDIDTNITSTSISSSFNSPTTTNDYFNLSTTLSPPPDSELADYKLVRKKSGELVKPSLKSPTYYYKKRSLSLPSTPTFKQVHFGGSNDVKYFHKKDKPAAISASNSPKLLPNDNETPFTSSSEDNDYDDENYDSQDSYDDDESSDVESKNPHQVDTKYPSKPMIDWELTLANFPPLSYLRKIESGTPVFLEKMFISNDKKNLLGYIAVKNLAFEKHLTVRYSLDHWLTIIELPTIYLQERPEVLKLNDYDRFMFKIPLNNLFNSIKFSKDSSTDSLENNDEDGSCHERAYQMCIKYDANFHEYWDNNNFNNYEIKLKRSIIQPPSRHPRQQHQTLIGSQIQEHTKKPRYSNSYLKRVASDSDITIKSSSSASSSGSLSKRQERQQKFFGEDEPMEMDQDQVHDDDEDVDMEDPNSSEISDFVKNNYYLSSPLLSSLHKNPDITDDYFTNSKTNSNSSAANNKNGSYTTTTNNNNSNNASSDHAKYKAKFQPHLSKLDTSDFNRNFMDDDSKQSSSANNNNNNGTSKTTTITNPKPIKTSTSTNLGPSFTGLTASNRNKFLNSKSYKELLENYCFFSSDTQDCDPTTTTSTTNSRNNSSSSSSSSEENEKITRNGSFTVSSFLGT